MSHDHRWIEITKLGDDAHQLVCSDCGARKTAPFKDIRDQPPHVFFGLTTCHVCTRPAEDSIHLPTPAASVH